MKRPLGLAAGALLFVVGCAGADAAPSSAHPPANLLGQEAAADSVTSMINNAVAGTLAGGDFTGTLSVTRFVADDGALFARVRLRDVSGLAESDAAALTAGDLELPLSVEPEGGFPSDGSEVFCQALSLVVGGDEVATSAGTLALDRTVLDTSTTPAASFVIGMMLCPAGVLASGGALVDLPGDLSEPLAVLNGIAGASEEEAGEDPAPSEASDDASAAAASAD